MKIIISNFPEELSFPKEIEANVRAAAEMVGQLYGVESGEVSVTLTTGLQMCFPLPSMKVRSRRWWMAPQSMYWVT